MVVRKRKKILKKRGHRTAGYGEQKKHRGGGSKGGRGMAGLHKHKFIYMKKYLPDHFGKRGFKRHFVVKPKAINLDILDSIVERMIDDKKIKEEGGFVKINLSDLGYDKLIGNGNIKHRLIVEAKAFSKNAIKKIEDKGGKIIIVN